MGIVPVVGVVPTLMQQYNSDAIVKFVGPLGQACDGSKAKVQNWLPSKQLL